jgi:hypothetical protein
MLRPHTSRGAAAEAAQPNFLHDLVRYVIPVYLVMMGSLVFFASV